MQSKPTVIDFFAGAGGLSLGFARAGFQVEMAVDCRKFRPRWTHCVAVVPRIWRSVMNKAQRDIRRKTRVLRHAARIGNVRKTWTPGLHVGHTRYVIVG